MFTSPHLPSRLLTVLAVAAATSGFATSSQLVSQIVIPAAARSDDTTARNGPIAFGRFDPGTRRLQLVDSTR